MTQMEHDLRSALESLEPQSPYGKRSLRSLIKEPYLAYHEIIEEHIFMEELQLSLCLNPQLKRKILQCFSTFVDISHILSKLEIYTLELHELYELKMFLLVYTDFYKLYRNELSRGFSMKFYSLRILMELLDPKGRRLPQYAIEDDATDILRDIRLQKRQIEKKMLSFKERGELEPERQKLVWAEETEELEIRKSLSEILRKYIGPLIYSTVHLGHLDLILAKVRMGCHNKGTLPCFSGSKRINMKDGIHLHISKSLHDKGKSFQPITINLKPGVTLITGANMGGKTVTWRTVLLNLALAHCGCYVMASSLSLPYLDYVANIELDRKKEGLSSFGNEVSALTKGLDQLGTGTGCLAIDEFGISTNPREGQLLVKALMRYLKEQDGFFIIISHFEDLHDESNIHYQVRGLMDFQDTNLVGDALLNQLYEAMDYSLIEITDRCIEDFYGLRVAELLGLNEHILNHAQRIRKEADSYGKLTT